MNWTLGLWAFNGQNTSQFGHPAPFPEELPRRLVKLFSFREDVVLDPFLGSGTTCRVAKNLGRRSIGIELNPEFCEIAANRCRQNVLLVPDAIDTELAGTEGKLSGLSEVVTTATGPP